MICRRLFAGFLCVLLLFCAGCVTQTTVIYESDLPDTTPPKTATRATQTTSTTRSTTTTVQVGPRPTLPSSFLENFEMWTEKESYPAGVEEITVCFRLPDYTYFSHNPKYTLFKWQENEWVGQPFPNPVSWWAIRYSYGRNYINSEPSHTSGSQPLGKVSKSIIDLTKLVEPLTPGTYRVVKSFDKGHIYCDFIVY